MRSIAFLYPELLIGSFHRRLRLGGEVPPDGGLIVYTNHSNGLIDTGMPLFVSKRPISYLAKASLFRIPVLNLLIRAVSAIPIYRQKDQVDMSKNDASFVEVYRLIHKGGALAIFPEGESLHGFKIRPFKTGMARMALGAEANSEQAQALQLVPIGVTYEEKNTLFSRVHVWVGKPSFVTSSLDAFKVDERETVRAVTKDLHLKLQSLIVPAEDLAQFRSILQLEQIHGESPEGAPERMRQLLREWRGWAKTKPGEVQEFQSRQAKFTKRLRRLGLEGYDLIGPVMERTSGMRTRSLFTLFLGLPLALLWAPPVLLSRLIAYLGRRTPDKLSTITVIGCSVLCPLYALGLVLLGMQYFKGAYCLGVVAVLGLAALWLVRRPGRPRPIRRALTYLGLQGREKTVDSLWIEKQNLLVEWRRALQSESLAQD